MILLIIIVLLYNVVHGAEWDECKTPKVEWTTLDKGQGQSMAYGMTIENSNIWIAGTFRESLTLQGPSISLTVASADTHIDETSDDIYIGKLDLNGNPMHLADFEGHGREVIIDLAAQNNMLVVAGYHLGNVTFGSTTLHNEKAVDSNLYDGFVSFFDTQTGEPVPIWAVNIANTRSTKLTGVAIDNTGYSTAITGYTCEEDISGGINSDTGMYDDLCFGFVKKYSNIDGSLLSTFSDKAWRPQGIRKQSSAANSFYVTGYVTESMIFPGSLSYTLVGNSDAVVLKLLSTNNFAWVTSLSSASETYSGWDLTIDGATIYAIGSATGLTENGYLAKISESNGSLVYFKSIPNARGLEVSNDGASVYLTNFQFSPLTLGSVVLELRGSADMILFKVDSSNGDGVWVRNMGGTGLEYPWMMAKDTLGNIYVTGLTGSDSFNFFQQEFYDTSIGFNNVFITKFSTGGVSQLPQCMVSTCDSIDAGHCFIGNECYTNGEGHLSSKKNSCFSCNPLVSQIEWTGPDESHCFIDGECYANNELKSNSKCQVCDISESTTEWTLKEGFALAPGNICATDGQAVGIAASCAGSQIYNEDFCGSRLPCYDATSDSCFETVQVCASGTLYTTQCPEFPLKPCYNTVTHDCVESNAFASFNEICGNSGQFIYTSQCPKEYPCFDHVNRYCTEADNESNSASSKFINTNAVVFVGVLFSLYAL